VKAIIYRENIMAKAKINSSWHQQYRKAGWMGDGGFKTAQRYQ